jgi:mannose-1-phosphate guanylyltransferase
MDETMTRTGHLWALILAAGDGSRVRDLTRTPDGAPAPKQFCVLGGGESLLRRTIDRAAALVPTERIVTVVAQQHRHWWETELSNCPRKNVVVQPENRGTATGILLPLLNIVRRDRAARIVLLPSDHHVEAEDVLRRAIRGAIRALHRDENRVVLLGMAPRECDTGYGWIVPSAEDQVVCPVAAFVEKPDTTRARFLLRRGALLNSLILVAAGRMLLTLFELAKPRLVGQFVSWMDEAGGRFAALDALYRNLSSCDFSREVLEPTCESLSVVRAPDCGWTDVGTPSRLRLVRNRRSEIGAPGVGVMCRI